jgi:hypothetical protein
MTLRKTVAGPTITVLSVLLSGCGPFGPDPSAIAKQWVTAMAKVDGATVNTLTCTAAQPLVKAALTDEANLLGLTAGLTGGGTVQVDATKLVFTTEDEKGSAATVRVVGPMRIKV